MGKLPILCEEGNVLPKADNESTEAFNMASLASGNEAVTLLSAPVKENVTLKKNCFYFLVYNLFTFLFTNFTAHNQFMIKLTSVENK